MVEIEQDALSPPERAMIEDLVKEIHSECPAQIQSRYISRIEHHRTNLPIRIRDSFWNRKRPILISNLPKFEDIEDSKILLLLFGETIGRCVAYSEYNQSYVTDIRPTPFSSEASSGSGLLDMHNDLAFATDACRPAALVLVPHLAADRAPKTLIVTADSLISSLPSGTVDVLRKGIFEIRSGSKLRWPCEQVRRISVIEDDSDGRARVRLNFENITPVSTLDEDMAKNARDALIALAEEALRLGRIAGHKLQKGEALLIPNDYCVHGRDVFETDDCERLLLRSYVVRDSTVEAQHGNTMLSLRI